MPIRRMQRKQTTPDEKKKHADLDEDDDGVDPGGFLYTAHEADRHDRNRKRRDKIETPARRDGHAATTRNGLECCLAQRGRNPHTEICKQTGRVS